MFPLSRFPKGSFERLEPYEWKRSCTVLRGDSGSNAGVLPDQILCFGTAVDAETFCNEKSALFLVMPEEDPNKFFMVSLVIQQPYREILAVADENSGKLKNRAVFFADKFGTLPKIESAEIMFSASRSCRLSIVPVSIPGAA